MSWQQVFKVFHTRVGIAIFLAFSAASFLSFMAIRRASLCWSRRWVWAWIAGGWCFAAFAYFTLHGLSERHVFGPGSDREDALQVACRTWLTGSFPYRHYTSLHNPITPMPGALLFAMPFYWIGHIGLQNLAWLAFFSYWCYRFFDRGWMSVWFLFSLVYFNPCIMQDVVTGGDFFTNLAYVVVIFAAVVRSVLKPDQRPWGEWVWPIVLGVALSSRPIYSLLYPCLLAVVWRSAGWLVALRTVCLTVVASLAVTLPIYFWDPIHFTPFTVGSNAYGLLPAGLHPPLLIFAVGLAVASTALFVTSDLRRALGIVGCALTAVTLPFFIADRMLRPQLFPLINLIYLSPGLLLLMLWLLRSPRITTPPETQLVPAEH